MSSSYKKRPTLPFGDYPSAAITFTWSGTDSTKSGELRE